MPRAGLTAAVLTDAAVALADRDGVGAVTFARLARELGVRAPSLYNHVASRDALLDEVARRAYDDAAAVLSAAIAGRSGPEALRALAGAYRAFAHAAPGRYAVAQRPLSTDEPGAVRLVATMAAALRAWDLEGDEETHAIRAIRSALHGFVALEQAGGFGLDLDRDVSYTRLVDMLVDGLGPV